MLIERNEDFVCNLKKKREFEAADQIGKKRKSIAIVDGISKINKD